MARYKWGGEGGWEGGESWKGARRSKHHGEPSPAGGQTFSRARKNTGVARCEQKKKKEKRLKKDQLPAKREPILKFKEKKSYKCGSSFGRNLKNKFESLN